MRLLLDTHTFIWAAAGVEHLHRLSEPARRAITDRSNDTLVSAASAWEMATKHRLGRLDIVARIVGQWNEALARLPAIDLSVTSEHALLAGGLVGAHGDPFDRLLAAQAIIEDAYLVTADRAMHGLGAQLLW